MRQSEENLSITLRAIAPGVYEGALAAPRGAVWRIEISDDARAWRLSGDWSVGEGGVTLEPAMR